MKRAMNIIRSIFTLSIIALLMGTATQSYFSDTETSAGNTFTGATAGFDSGGFGTEELPIELSCMRPCQTGYYNTSLINEGETDLEIWKHLKDVVCLENGITEPEQEWYDSNDIGSLRGYWRFEEGEDWDGTTDEVKDRSSYENHGTALNGAIQSNPGKVGQCGEFDGDNDYISIDPSPYQFGTGESFTVECWMKTDEDPAEREEILGIYSSPTYPVPNQFWSMFLEDNGKLSFWLRVDNNAAQTVVYSTNQVNDNAWHHIAMVKDMADGKMHLYIDGAPETPVTFVDGETQNGNDLHIADGCWDRYYEGMIDEVAIWGRALEDTEIKDHHDDPGIIEGSGNDIDQAILYDMWIDNDGNIDECGALDQWIIKEEEGWYISQNDDRPAANPPTGSSTVNGVSCHWMYLGILPVGESMKIVQSYHMEGETENWAQSDRVVFTIEYYAQSVGGAAPGIELPGHGQSDWPPYA